MSDAPAALLREVRLLRAYVIASTAVFGSLALMALRRPAAPTRFEEIDVQRINVREPDGKLRMVLSNRPRSPGGIAHGTRLPGDGNRAGIIFYNDEETENGGLAFDGKADGAGHNAGALLSFDQYDQDQVVTLSYDDQNGQRTMGLSVLDRPDVAMVPWFATMDSINRLPDGAEKTAARQRLFAPLQGRPMTARRVFVGRDSARAAVLRLSDPYGRPRLRFIVDSAGAARIEFLDARGRITQQLPASAPADSARVRD